jgi:hypothetical protein
MSVYDRQVGAMARSAAGATGCATGICPPPRVRRHPNGRDVARDPGAPNSALGDVPPDVYRPTNPIDVHEILKREAFAASAASCDNHFEKNRPCPSDTYGVSDHYIVLDSQQKVETSRTWQGEFQFNMMVQGTTGDQVIGIKDRAETIIGITATKFCIPLLPLDDFVPATLIAGNPALVTLGLAANGALPAGDNVVNAQSQVPFCGRVTVFLREIGLQSFSDVDRRRHHFEFQAEVAPDGRSIVLDPIIRFRDFWFTEPIQDIHGLTACFFNPNDQLRFPPDVFYEVAVQSDAGSLLEFTATAPNGLINLAVGDRVYVKGFAAAGAAADTGILDAYVGRADGHIVGAGGFVLSADGRTVTFRLNPDVSLAGPPVLYPPSTPITSTTPVRICVAKNRVRIPLRLRGIVQRLTNYAAPSII